MRTHFVTTLLCVEVQMYFKICNEVKIRMTYFVLRVSGQLEKGEVHNILDKPVIISSVVQNHLIAFKHKQVHPKSGEF